MKQLPIGIPTYREIVERGMLYVDKTEILHKLINGSGRYFLSRPRRFGKSLTCSTLEEIFNGDKELFQDTWIGKSDYDWKVRPVIYFDLGQIDHSTPEKLTIGLHRLLDNNANKYDVILRATEPKDKLDELITAVGSTRNPVAVLIDEYDQPITSLIDNIKQAELSRMVLEDFYGAFKGTDVNKNMRFLFFTGISKFAKISMFSKLNNLDDITCDDTFAAITGYTDQEVSYYLREHIQALADSQEKSYDTIRYELKRWYNGYRFSDAEITVYNPFSLHSCLSKKKMLNFWFKTGTSSSLLKFIKKSPDIADKLDKLDNSFIGEGSLDSLTIDNFYENYKTIFLQTGYLTFISDYDEKNRRYKIGYPNEEVRYSMAEQILQLITDTSWNRFDEFIDKFRKDMAFDNLESFCKNFQDFIKTIPYDILGHFEQSYHLAFFMTCRLLGGKRLDTEVATELGLMDMLIEGENTNFVIEFKRDKTPDNALAQIEEKKYWEVVKIREPQKKLILAGISFNRTEDGAIVLCKTKSI